MIIDFVSKRSRRRAERDPSYTERSGRMDDAEFEAQCERVESLIRSLLPTMGLANYSARLTLAPGPLDERGSVMSVSSDWRYEWLHIDASVEQCAEETDDELTYDVLHEGAHCHLALLRSDDPTPEEMDREELAATRIGRMTLAFGVRCADQVREEYEQKLAERDREIARLKKGGKAA